MYRYAVNQALTRITREIPNRSLAKSREVGLSECGIRAPEPRCRLGDLKRDVPTGQTFQTSLGRGKGETFEGSHTLFSIPHPIASAPFFRRTNENTPASTCPCQFTGFSGTWNHGPHEHLNLEFYSSWGTTLHIKEQRQLPCIRVPYICRTQITRSARGLSVVVLARRLVILQGWVVA